MATVPLSRRSLAPAKEQEATSAWTKAMQLTPVVLTLLATALAGISSSEMTQAMYFRTLASQHQAKAGDQWAFFQAKRIRGTSLEGTASVLRNVAHVVPLTTTLIDKAPESVRESLAAWRVEAEKNQVVGMVLGKSLPTIEEQSLSRPEDVERLAGALQIAGRPHAEAELAKSVKELSPHVIEAATATAEKNADAFDKACEPASQAMKQLRALSDTWGATTTEAGAEQVRQLAGSIELASLDFDARRYRRESTFNMKTATHYELRVARSALESDVHRERSRMFFFSMLMAQVGVTVSSLALARSNHSLFWTIAALAGICSLVFTGFTYLTLN